MKRNFFAALSALVLLGLIAGCESPSRYQQKTDSGPSQSMSVDHIPDAVPKVEIRTTAGNKSPYRVNGKTYHVMQKPEGYREEGIASWYGQKFHGHLTSNGEIYNMYAMTAAHKTLPIPSYVRVTNKTNGRSVIVRVNDRGPFHSGRVIDLTYAAAKKIGIADTGTGKVLVEYIDPRRYVAPTSPRASSNKAPKAGSVEPLAPTPENANGYQIPENTFLQVGAFSQKNSAMALQQRIAKLTQYPVSVVVPSGAKALYKVRIGPLKDNFDLLTLRQKLADAKMPTPHVVYQ
ncbi:rare lipoprotein A [Alteromonadaceae bacterium 2753L.S.0a.02]|nr:rare lipoprotein A [Alteromonadaceae bacterium 2753L.S.0a.02]